MPEVQTTADYTVVAFSAQPVENGAIVLLPGFPGIASKRNEDLASFLAGTTQQSVFVLQYPGLGANPQRPFSFSESSRQAEALFRHLAEKYSWVSVVGHSWGGFLSLLHADRYLGKLQSLVLASPFWGLDDPQKGDAIVRHFAGQHPGIFGKVPLEEVAADFNRLVSRAALKTQIGKTEFRVNQVKILQALHDEETPVEIARESRAAFAIAPIYDETNNDHSFLLHRESFFAEIARRLRP